MNTYIEEKQGDFENIMEYFKKDISSIRTGRANPAVLEGVMVEAYGVKTPLNGVANINVADSQSLLVAPWDKSVIKDVEKAIVDADLGLGVMNDGEKIRLTVPQMTEENRKELVKKLNEKMEKSRISVRQLRDDIKDGIEKDEKEKEISEDDKFSSIKELDERIREFNDEIKNIRDSKEADIMTI
ncbi:MAG: ribosome recycling factor [Patescibacteria group bacterium]|jgi:ribosome recycling factor|nr:ribosome recycling factor [Patescibacteria group bacterium]